MPIPIRLYNTLSRRVEELVPEEVRNGDRPFGMYTCGPTVQDVPHFGHARAALVPDLVRRLIEHDGIKVVHLRNITDVDDKIIARADGEGRLAAATVAEQFAGEYLSQMQRLGVLSPTISPRATGHIVEIIEMIQRLIDTGHAYAMNTSEAAEGNDVAFRVRSFDNYGQLSGRNVDDMQAGARIAADDRKEDPADFALWKAAKPGEPSWNSPWGLGRPGWHIECSAMADTYFTNEVGTAKLDLHTGGNDLIFPHHENEIAQYECAREQRFARIWMHNGMLQIDGEKMSKSLGNFITLKDALDTYGPAVIRLFFMQHHYRSEALFSPDLLADVQTGWERITTFLAATSLGEGTDGAFIAEHVDAALTPMRDDLNTPQTIAYVFKLVKIGNAHIAAGETEQAGYVASAVAAVLQILGFPTVDRRDETDVAPLVETLLELRQQARQNKDYATADSIRDSFTAAGIIVEDSRDGARWRKGRA